MSRRIILSLAMSLDGYIADESGGYDWIVGDGDTPLDMEQAFSFSEFLASVDTLVMGRKAYEDGDMGLFADKKLIVATSRHPEPAENIEFVQDPLAALLRLREEQGKAIWVYGGGELADVFIKAGLVDEYLIGLIPTILGAGRPLFLADNPTIPLHLDEYTVSEGIVMLRYSPR